MANNSMGQIISEAVGVLAKVASSDGMVDFAMYSGTSLLEEKVCFLSGKLKKMGRSTFSLAIIDAARVLSLSSPSFKIPISERNDFPFSVSERPELTNLSSRDSNAL